MTLSRRGLVLGAGIGVGALVTGCGAQEVAGNVPPEGGSFVSEAMKGRRIGWRLAYPADHQRGRLPVVISLHGRGGSHQTTFRRMGLGGVLDEVVSGGTAPFALASVDGGDHSYWHPRADGTDPVTMLREEFLPQLADLDLDTGRIGLYGWSMGGYGSLLLAGKEWLPVRGVAVSSPALFASAGAAAAGAFDGPDDFAEHDVYGNPAWLDDVPLHVNCGWQDPFYNATRNFVGRLTTPPEGGFTRGKHEPSYWRTVAPAQFRFLGQHLSG